MGHQVAAKTEEPKGTILIVDDNRNNREMFKMCLELEGYHVLCARDGREGLEELFRAKPDVILLDMMMPVMNGREMLEKVREEFGLLDMPVMMLSVKSDTHDVADALEMGANDYLRKPFDIDELVARVNNLAKIRHCTRNASTEADAEKSPKSTPAGAMQAPAPKDPLRSAAHDFNNLLFQVIGYLELSTMSMSDQSPELRRNIDNALSAARKAETMAQTIYTIASKKGK